jgi:hypothetical protein
MKRLVGLSTAEPARVLTVEHRSHRITIEYCSRRANLIRLWRPRRAIERMVGVFC